jgi:hypothetical protein
MCFSAPASFIAAAVAGTAGAACLARVREPGDWPLASMPVFFALQQAIEGFLWLHLARDPTSMTSTALTEGFLMFALVFWPVFAPLAAYAAEPDPRRKPWIALCIAAGIAVALYFFTSLADAPRTASIQDHHIAYSADPDLPFAIRVLYPVATCLSLMLSSHRAVALAGFVIFVGSMVAYWMYWNAFTSVWCFFAAIASALIIFHFERARRAATANAGPR